MPCDRSPWPSSAHPYAKPSVGRVVMENIVKGGFEGEIWPVNPKYRRVAGQRCYRTAGELPGIPDLGVIVTPPETVPGIVRDLGEKGTRAAVVITAGLTHENGLRQAMLEAARPYLFRIIGPNTLGLMIPPVKLNAGFAHMAAKPGNIALLSQSGAIATSLIDWAAETNIGFSHIVSLGDMADVDVGDYLDMLAGDSQDARHRDVSRNDSEPAQVHVCRARGSAHQAGDSGQVRTARAGSQGRRDAYRRPVWRGSRCRGGAAAGRHPAGEGARRIVRRR